MSILLMLFVCIPILADEATDYFEYEDEEKTIISDITISGLAQSELHIPASVVTVREYAFAFAQNLTDLYIDGGDPEFEPGFFGYEEENKLALIDMGDGMTKDHMRALIENIGYVDALRNINITGCKNDPTINICWDDEDMEAILTDRVHVNLPAAKVDDQVFGSALVYGHFVINNDLSTFCGKSSFLDTDDGSNMLFYIPTEFRVDDRLVFIERVHYIVAGEGVLIHNVKNTSSQVYLPRISEEEAQDGMESSYDQNMLVGVTDATEITATDGNYTNFILYQGNFHPTTGGKLGANKAYLQVLTEDYNKLPLGASLSYVYDDTNTVKHPCVDTPHASIAKENAWYTLNGQRLGTKPKQPGIYLHQGKTVIVNK